MAPGWEWILFNVFVLLMLMLDLGVFNRKDHTIRVREALMFSAFWIFLALVFNVVVYYIHGRQAAIEYLTGYLIEKSLSMDNLFVFLMIFSYFKVKPQYQHKVLFWGILGALVLRAIFIFAGVALIVKFHWMIYLFGLLLIYSGYKMAVEKDKEVNPEKNPVVKWFRKLIPVSLNYDNGHFFTRIDGKRFATPLFIVLLVVETSDIMFAIDSIPAILAITHDPFIVYSSNVFAILGLRALFFALAGVMNMFHFLHYGLSVILVFVGVKMMIAQIYKIPTGIALGVLATILTVSIVASILWPPSEKNPSKPI